MRQSHSSADPPPPALTHSPMQRQTPNHVDTVCQCRGWARPRDENSSVNMGRQQGASLSPSALLGISKREDLGILPGPNFVVSAQGLFRRFPGCCLWDIVLSLWSTACPFISCVSFVNSITIYERNLLFLPVLCSVGFNSSVSAPAHILSVYSVIDLCCWPLTFR